MTDFDPETTKLRHICESCGKEEVLTAAEGFQQGWDYPPSFYAFGILSPRTCGECGIDTTLWWRLVTANQKGETYQPTEAELALIERINAEPGSIIVTPNQDP